MTTTAARLTRPTRSRRRAGGWVLVTAELGFAVLYAASFGLSLARAADLAGRWHIPEQNDALTGDLGITDGWAWAFLAVPVVTSAFMVSILALFVSAVVLISGYAQGRRRLTIALAVSTVVMLVMLVASLTPSVMSVSGWLLD